MSSASEDELSIRSDDDDGAHSEAEEAPASRRRKRSQNEGESEDAEADAAVEAVADVETKGVKAVRKVTAPRPKFTVDVLLGATGLSRVVKQFPKIKFKPGSDAQKLVELNAHYRDWAFRMFPNMSFPNIISRIEKFGSAKRVRHEVQDCRARARGESVLERDPNNMPSDPLPDESDLTFADLQQTASADNPSDSISSSTRPNAARSADDFGDDTDLVNTMPVMDIHPLRTPLRSPLPPPLVVPPSTTTTPAPFTEEQRKMVAQKRMEALAKLAERKRLQSGDANAPIVV